MKRILSRTLILGWCLVGFASCSDDNPPTPPTIPTESGDLTAVVKTMVFPVLGILNYTPPTDDEKKAFRDALELLLEGKESDALTAFKNLNLALTRFTDASGPTFLLIREKSATPRGWGLYAINTKGSRKLLLEAPHPIADLATEGQATSYFLTLSARGLLIAGAHRCASTVFSPCSGTTALCNTSSIEESFRIADAAHSEEQVFQTAHEILMNFDPSLTAVALHGFNQLAGDPHAFVSDGTETVTAANSLTNRFVAALKTETGVSNAGQSCNDGSSGIRLCGTDDLQGRVTNGSENICTTDAPSGSQRFLHVEQSMDLRTDQGPGDPLTPTSVLNVLSQLF